MNCLNHFLFTSEPVPEGHPDKMCDHISDAILDADIEKELMYRVACETTVSTGLVHIMDEVSTSCYVDIGKITCRSSETSAMTRPSMALTATPAA